MKKQKNKILQCDSLQKRNLKKGNFASVLRRDRESVTTSTGGEVLCFVCMVCETIFTGSIDAIGFLEFVLAFAKG